MPKPEINDLYLQLLQLKAQNSKLIHELLLQKQSWWQKNYGSVVAILSIISSYIVANRISLWSFKNQRTLEEDKRTEEKTKVSQDTFKRIYSELSAALFEFINKSARCDFHKIHFEYYKELSNLLNRFGDEKNILEYKTKGEDSHEKMMNQTIIVIDVFNKINKLCYEYEYLKNESEAVKLIRNFTDNINGFTHANMFKIEIEKSLAVKKVVIYEFINKRQALLDLSVVEHDEKLKPIIEEIQKIIKLETGILPTKYDEINNTH